MHKLLGNESMLIQKLFNWPVSENGQEGTTDADVWNGICTEAMTQPVTDDWWVNNFHSIRGDQACARGDNGVAAKSERVAETRFLLGLLRTAMMLQASPSCRENLEREIGHGWFFVSDNTDNSQSTTLHGGNRNANTANGRGSSIDDMKERVVELEKECNSMKQEFKKVVKAKKRWNVFCGRKSEVRLNSVKPSKLQHPHVNEHKNHKNGDSS
ncbi:hypothetical protein HAX54_016042 [Datura stramonium]|uniref:NPH3 domain-containing protein n=1 Tax=Datura stramonium TaxID=4076 RepID=A0ABS8UI87_DATST|nr:hypothetical protein [Datura stramonium]